MRWRYSVTLATLFLLAVTVHGANHGCRLIVLYYDKLGGFTPGSSVPKSFLPNPDWAYEHLIGDRRNIVFFKELARHPDPILRDLGLGALYRLRDHGWADEQVATLGDESTKVAQGAAWRLYLSRFQANDKALRDSALRKDLDGETRAYCLRLVEMIDSGERENSYPSLRN